MPKATDPAYVIYGAPDLNKMAAFMTDFGLSVARQTSTELWMKGSGGAPFVHYTRLAEKAAFIGAAFEVTDIAALEEIAHIDGAPIENNEGPGGGKRVRMEMADGIVIDAVAGRLVQTESDDDPQVALNFYRQDRRIDKSVRLVLESKHVRRLGHFVLHVRDHDACVKWLQRRFGLQASDFLGVAEPDGKIVGTFLRVNQGEVPVDHHCLLVLETPHPGCHHCSFEMAGLDDLMVAHDYLVAQGYQADVGVGRHMLGSQIFDYWWDPFGFRVEHYTDGDRVTQNFKSEVFRGSADETTQWGARPSAEFFD